MFIVGPVACLATIALLCLILFVLAVYAVPFFFGGVVGLWAFHSGAGVPGAIVVGRIAACVALAVFRTCSAETRPGWMRLSARVVFVVTAVLAGFLAVNGVARLIVPSEVWQVAFSVDGALVVGATALRRIGVFRHFAYFGDGVMFRPGLR